jgi:hypothetical protein
MSSGDWPKGHWFQVECDRDGCGTLLSEVPTLPRAFDAMLEAHDECRPCVVTVVRRGRAPAKKRSRWSIWLHTGPHVEDEDEAA